MIKKILIGLLILLIIGQFIRPPYNNGSAQAATDITHAVQVPDTVMGILKTSCYDCHSNYTRYPWYSKITPVNWWLYNHIADGKRGLNFSAFTMYTFKKQAKRMDDIAETVDKHEMPLDSYLWIHKNAKLSDAQRQILIDWTKTAKQQVLQDSLRKLVQ